MPRTSERATTELTLFECNRRGWELWETTWIERFRSPRGLVTVRKDLLGFADGLVFRPSQTIALQWTTNNNLAARVRKLRALPAVHAALEAGWRVLVWGFDLKTGRLREKEI